MIRGAGGILLAVAILATPFIIGLEWTLILLAVLAAFGLLVALANLFIWLDGRNAEHRIEAKLKHQETKRKAAAIWDELDRYRAREADRLANARTKRAAGRRDDLDVPVIPSRHDRRERR